LRALVRSDPEPKYRAPARDLSMISQWPAVTTWTVIGFATVFSPNLLGIRKPVPQIVLDPTPNYGVPLPVLGIRRPQLRGRRLVSGPQGDQRSTSPGQDRSDPSTCHANEIPSASLGVKFHTFLVRIESDSTAKIWGGRQQQRAADLRAACLEDAHFRFPAPSSAVVSRRLGTLGIHYAGPQRRLGEISGRHRYGKNARGRSALERISIR
jgi:hypothetical protein